MHRTIIRYLTVTLRGRAGYELIYITNVAVGRVGYYQLISGKSEKNNCFSKFSSNSLDFFRWNLCKSWHFLYQQRLEKICSDLQNFSTRNSPSVFPYLVKLNDNGSDHGLREPIRKLENHYHELKNLLTCIIAHRQTPDDCLQDKCQDLIASYGDMEMKPVSDYSQIAGSCAWKQKGWANLGFCLEEKTRVAKENCARA